MKQMIIKCDKCAREVKCVAEWPYNDPNGWTTVKLSGRNFNLCPECDRLMTKYVEANDGK